METVIFRYLATAGSNLTIMSKTSAPGLLRKSLWKVPILLNSAPSWDAKISIAFGKGTSQGRGISGEQAAPPISVHGERWNAHSLLSRGTGRACGPAHSRCKNA